MNVRISSDETRFRISAEEFSRLGGAAVLEEKIFLPGPAALALCLEVRDEIEEASVTYDENTLCMTISRAVLGRLPESGRKGLSWDIDCSGGGSSRLVLQIDAGRG